MFDVSTLTRRWLFGLSLAVMVMAVSGSTMVQADDGSAPVYRKLFDGKSLTGWSGNGKYWKVEDGAIVAESTPENPCTTNSFLLWNDGLVDNFIFRCKFKLTGDKDKANSGVQFRSQIQPDGHVVGYQADIDLAAKWLGCIYDEHGRGVLGEVGNVVYVDESHKPQKAKAGQIPDWVSKLKVVTRDELKTLIDSNDWIEYSIQAQDNVLVNRMNGHVTCVVIDGDEANRDFSGHLALQIHSGPPEKVMFKDIELARLPMNQTKKIVVVAGRPSHAPLEHEHNAGCALLVDRLNKSDLNVSAVLYKNGWPADPTAFDNANSIVFYCDGGNGHYVMQHLKELDQVMKKGVGLVCIHYAVEIPAGEPGNYFLNWIGGYFEANWSVNPHWVGHFEKLPVHPSTRGVNPFSTNDEWYYHMRFREGMENVTPILSDLPPPESLSRPDGPHSGNPYVRDDVLNKKEPQHVAWAYDRPDGSHGFGITGAHYHKNWMNDDFRKLVLNAIVWTAGVEVPTDGVKSVTPTEEEIKLNVDPKPPRKPNPASKVEPKKDEPAKTDSSKTEPEKKTSELSPKGETTFPGAAFESKVVTSKTAGHAVEIEANIKNAKQLYLLITDSGNGYSCDWADWLAPRVVGPQGEFPLTDWKWESAHADFGTVNVNQNIQGQPLTVNDQVYQNGIGAHANSLISYKLPEGHAYTTFKAKGGLDKGGVGQGDGKSTSVKFYVFTENPDVVQVSAAEKKVLEKLGMQGYQTAQESLDDLKIYEGLNVGLFAYEPMITNPTSIDIDQLGRVWVAEGFNYRHFRNTDLPLRAEGDRIVVLEDLDHDGVADKATTFYQHPDFNCPHGVCVLGDRVIVSMGDKIFSLFDDNHDLKADRQEVLFAGIKGKDHDHGVHGVMFGPDGKLYFNIGNEGQQLGDAKTGEPLIDKAGHRVVPKREPYQEGMAFRCNLDGSELETLGWNFRNPWEVCVDSLGTMWQSDNDDDGNRGTRINYVMEFGNYGYKDEMTGAGWKSPRTNLETEIPLQHWHLNDPGVVPNMLQTGAGSPCGICVYEGTLLPKVFQNQIIHCDPGPNVVRAYPAKVDGAGYSAEIVNILEATNDRWFRPIDECVAHDGSLLIADWYDAGVGGHRMQDNAHGRIYRVAPPKTPYLVPTVDLNSVAGLVKALQSPNLSTRYLAFTGLQKLGWAQAAPALKELLKSGTPRHQVRALWLLSKLPTTNDTERAQKLMVLQQAMSPSAPEEHRIVAIRAARQLQNEFTVDDFKDAIAINDPSPAVRREILLALHNHDFQEVPQIWAQLAQLYPQGDRWYLEALGIAADGQWDRCLDAYFQLTHGQMQNQAARDIIWRSRGSKSAELILSLIESPETPAAEIPRLFRALDFQKVSAERLAKVAFETPSTDKDRQNLITREALNRITNVSDEIRTHYKAAILQALSNAVGTPTYLSLINKFSLKDNYPQLLELIVTSPDQQLRVDAARLLIQKKEYSLLEKTIKADPAEKAELLVLACGLTEENGIGQMLDAISVDTNLPLSVRRAAIKGMSRNKDSVLLTLKRVQAGKTPEGLEQAIASAFNTSNFPNIRDAGKKYFPQPPSKDAKPLPPISDLAKRNGDAKNGRIVFFSQGTCHKCHVVNGMGKEIGPNLSEIGKKLSREAMYESILYPSAGISHNYESYLIITSEGQTVNGLLVSETDQEIRLKNEEGIERVVKTEDILEKKKQEMSMMPADIQKLITEQELVDMVEYLMTLQKKE
jgi:putative membrane-bound dehydrogenase-like protein